MSEVILLAGWLIAAALTLFAGVVLLLAVAIVYTLEDDRRLMERPADGFRPDAGDQGWEYRGPADGSAGLHLFNGRKKT